MTTKPIELDRNDPFEAAVADMVELNRKKRADYTTGNDLLWNFRYQSEEMGLDVVECVNFLIAVKQGRIKALQRLNRKKPKNESLEDTYIDRAVYSVLALVALREGVND